MTCSLDSFMSDQLFLHTWLVRDMENNLSIYRDDDCSFYEQVTGLVTGLLEMGSLWLQETCFSSYAYCTGYTDPLVDRLKDFYQVRDISSDDKDRENIFLNCGNKNPLYRLSLGLQRHRWGLENTYLERPCSWTHFWSVDVKEVFESVQARFQNWNKGTPGHTIYEVIKRMQNGEACATLLPLLDAINLEDSQLDKNVSYTAYLLKEIMSNRYNQFLLESCFCGSMKIRDIN